MKTIKQGPILLVDNAKLHTFHLEKPKKSSVSQSGAPSTQGEENSHIPTQNNDSGQ